jgi:hypothetical protein
MSYRTTPRLFFKFFVEPNYSDFLAQPDDVRLGFNASLSAFQQTDIFYQFYRRHDPQIVAEWPTSRSLHIHLAKLNPHYLTVQSVATVYKHLYSSGAHYETGSPMAIWGVVYSPGKLKIRTEWGEGTGGRVVVTRRGKSSVPLDVALKSVVEDLWPSVLPREN